MGDAAAQPPVSAPPKPFEEAAPSAPAQSEPLPKLTPVELRIFNRLAEHMDHFHNMFRRTWTTLHTACATDTRPPGMSIRAFLTTGLDFCAHLEAHHGIEEAHVFPVLARKMPAFRRELQLLSQHQEIHTGLEKMRAYLEECRRGERELRLGELKEVLDGFGSVLWTHLDEEVRELGAENMRRFWTVEEMRRMPF
ncbi:hypothetical protein K432DRAFT_300900 [Lepidopterella palustris CBS 459.81]|uniref:Hemerythrin-like domain-containing protein n=1 Tax=Lepidopterella palustris CBS 459.81 TaxID=1314670 RepID=A0A8E2E7T4_9PEZI|nr:hypothetical protein K432DRAFT_300900 [Lepidopterella palustris CBS 459.81]